MLLEGLYAYISFFLIIPFISLLNSSINSLSSYPLPLAKSLNETEHNYEIHNKEMLVVTRGLENWRYLLQGAKFQFKI